MPKIKTNRAAAKRFRKTGSGKFKCGHAFRSHILTKKSTKRKRNLRGPNMVRAEGPIFCSWSSHLAVSSGLFKSSGTRSTNCLPLDVGRISLPRRSI